MKRLIAAACLVVIATAAMGQAWWPFGFGFGAGGGTITPPTTCNAGALDLSTGCSQLMAYGGLF